MKRFIAMLVLLLWAVGLNGSAGASFRVWCVGSDGHAGVEYAVGGKCNAGPVVKLSSNLDSALASVDHCGPCADVALASSTSATRSATAIPAPVEKVVYKPLPVFLLPVPIEDQSFSTSNIGDPPDLFSAFLLQHRSVVLLI